MPGVLELYDTASRRRVPFVPANPERVTFYSCGPTVYDDAHIGNFRAFLVADLLRRWIEHPWCRLATEAGGTHDGPRRVDHVMNITDVGHMTEDDAADGGGEDKMALAGRRIEAARAEAKKAGREHESAGIDAADPHAVASFYTARFIEDATGLGLKVAREAAARPGVLPRASDHVPGMIAAIERIVERGLAYVTGEAGSRAVYFDVQRMPGYGSLSGNDVDHLRGGAGGRVSDLHQQQKRHPADFLLWKEDERHLMKWPSPWGVGYPGWHIECTAMSFARLIPGGLERVLARPDASLTIDLHSGGEDNIFPHHECEIAQSRGLTGGDRFARCWLHTRFLMVGGEKMSKSRGTFFTPRRLMADGFDPAAIRLELIKTHYRVNADFSIEGLRASAKQIERWRRFVSAGEASPAAGEPDASVRDELAAALHDDLNVAEAIGVLNRWINRVAAPTRADAALLRSFDGALGLLDLETASATETAIGVFVGVDPDPEVEALLARRRDARKAKDFAAADAIRDQLTARGLAIKDAPGGRVEVTRG